MSYSGRYIPTHPKKYKGNPTTIYYRSLWERKFMVYCDKNDRILEWGSEEIQIPHAILNQKNVSQNHSSRQSHEKSESLFKIESAEVISPLQIDAWNNQAVDIRPRLKDGFGVTYLLDTGSQTCVWPASADD